MILPSPSGPFWCRQTFEIADIFPSYLKIATRSPLRETTVAHFSGISVTAQTFTNPFAAGPSFLLSTLASRRAAARLRPRCGLLPGERSERRDAGGYKV